MPSGRMGGVGLGGERTLSTNVSRGTTQAAIQAQPRRLSMHYHVGHQTVTCLQTSQLPQLPRQGQSCLQTQQQHHLQHRPQAQRQRPHQRQQRHLLSRCSSLAWNLLPHDLLARHLTVTCVQASQLPQPARQGQLRLQTQQQQHHLQKQPQALVQHQRPHQRRQGRHSSRRPSSTPRPPSSSLTPRRPTSRCRAAHPARPPFRRHQLLQQTQPLCRCVSHRPASMAWFAKQEKASQVTACKVLGIPPRLPCSVDLCCCSHPSRRQACWPVAPHRRAESCQSLAVPACQGTRSQMLDCLCWVAASAREGFSVACVLE